jgi:hypothetical protein
MSLLLPVGTIFATPDNTRQHTIIVTVSLLVEQFISVLDRNVLYAPTPL